MLFLSPCTIIYVSHLHFIFNLSLISFCLSYSSCFILLVIWYLCTGLWQHSAHEGLGSRSHVNCGSSLRSRRWQGGQEQSKRKKSHTCGWIVGWKWHHGRFTTLWLSLRMDRSGAGTFLFVSIFFLPSLDSSSKNTEYNKKLCCSYLVWLQNFWWDRFFCVCFLIVHYFPSLPQSSYSWNLILVSISQRLLWRENVVRSLIRAREHFEVRNLLFCFVCGVLACACIYSCE